MAKEYLRAEVLKREEEEEAQGDDVEQEEGPANLQTRPQNGAAHTMPGKHQNGTCFCSLTT